MELKRFYSSAKNFKITEDYVESHTHDFVINKSHIINVVNLPPEGEWSGQLAIQTNERLMLFNYLEDQVSEFEKLESLLMTIRNNNSDKSNR